MEACNCVDTQWFTDDLLIKYQYLSDYFIAVAYFSITMELLFFVKKAAFFPCRWVLIQFGASIFLCGATHLINLWTLSTHSKIVAVVMTVAKLSTALVSCAVALTLLNFIPQLLKVKKMDSILKRRADELNMEMGLILTEEELDQIIFFRPDYFLFEKGFCDFMQERWQ